MKELCYGEAVHLFEAWGFQVEPGPGADEVSLILERPESRTYTVHPKDVLPRIAALSLAVRWRNQKVMSWTGLARGKTVAAVRGAQTDRG